MTKNQDCVKTRRTKVKAHLSLYDPLPGIVKRVVDPVENVSHFRPRDDALDSRRTITKDVRSVKIDFNSVIERCTPKPFAPISSLLPANKNAFHSRQNLRLACYSKYPKLTLKSSSGKDIGDPVAKSIDDKLELEHPLLAPSPPHVPIPNHQAFAPRPHPRHGQINGYYPTVRRAYEEVHHSRRKVFPNPAAIAVHQRDQVNIEGSNDANVSNPVVDPRSSKVSSPHTVAVVSDQLIPGVDPVGDSVNAGVVPTDIPVITKPSTSRAQPILSDDQTIPLLPINNDHIPTTKDKVAQLLLPAKSTIAVPNTPIDYRNKQLSDRMSQVQDWLSAHDPGAFARASNNYITSSKQPDLSGPSPHIQRLVANGKPGASGLLRTNEVPRKNGHVVLRRKLLNNFSASTGCASGARAGLSGSKTSDCALKTTIDPFASGNSRRQNGIDDTLDLNKLDQSESERFFSSTPRANEYRFQNVKVRYTGSAGQNELRGMLDMTPIKLDAVHCSNLNQSQVVAGLNPNNLPASNFIAPVDTIAPANPGTDNDTSKLADQRRRKMLHLLFGLVDSDLNDICRRTRCVPHCSTGRVEINPQCDCSQCQLVPSSPETISGLTNLERRTVGRGVKRKI